VHGVVGADLRPDNSNSKEDRQERLLLNTKKEYLL
jgi:hypothetical protein